MYDDLLIIFTYADYSYIYLCVKMIHFVATETLLYFCIIRPKNLSLLNLIEMVVNGNNGLVITYNHNNGIPSITYPLFTSKVSRYYVVGCFDAQK